MAKVYKFDSGLTLLYEKNCINKSTSIEICFNCGSSCDGNLPGLAHFCEHMFFSGTDKLSKQEIADRYFDFVNVNAHTTTEDITFTGTIISARLSEYLSVVQDMICNSKFSEQAIEEEKKVVIQEIVRDADNYPLRAYELESYALYGIQHYKNGTLGSVESVESIKSKDVRKYVKKYFVKNNCIISICSGLSFSKVKSIVKTHFEDKMPESTLKPLPYKEDDFVDESKVILKKNQIGKNFLSIYFKSNKSGADVKSRVLMGMMSSIISDFSTGISKELRLDKSLVYSVGMYYLLNKKNSSLIFSTEISKENIKPCLQVVCKYFKTLMENGFSKDQFDKELKKNEYYWHTDIKTPHSICSNMMSVRLYGKCVSYQDIYDQYGKITLDELNGAIKQLLSESQVLIAVYGDADKKDIYTLNQLEKFWR